MSRPLQIAESSVVRRLFGPWLLVWGLWAGIVAGSAPLFLSTPEKTEWAWVYRRAALRMQAGEPVNVIEPVAYAYPPAMAFLTVPLSNGSPRLGALAWLAINAAALAVLMTGCQRLCGGPRPFEPLDGRWLLVFITAMLLNLRYTIAPLQHQQFDLVIAALVVGGCWALAAGRKAAAGISIGTAAAMKCTPLLFLPWLLWRREWKAAALLLTLAVGLNVLPDAVFPQTNGRRYGQDWIDSFAAAPARQGPGQWFTEPSQNQSLAGTMARWFGRPSNAGPSEIDAPGAADDRAAIDNDRSAERDGENARLLRIIVYGTSFLLLLTTVLVCGRPLKPLGQTPAGPPTSDAAGQRLDAGSHANADRHRPRPTLQLAIESSAVCCLMLLLSPMTGKAHFVVMLLPCFLLARLAVLEGDRRLWFVLALMAVAGPLTTKGILGRDLGGVVLDWGLPTLYLVLGLVGSWLAVRYRDQPMINDA